MISEIIIPDLGTTGGDVVLHEWLVEVGESVKAGQSLFVVQTEKATVEVEAFRDGVLREIKVAVGETVPLGCVVAVLADAMDETGEPAQQNVVNYKGEQIRLNQQPKEIDSKLDPDQYRRILITPLARRIAQEEGLDLTTLIGSGEQGEILKQDVIAALAIKDNSKYQHEDKSYLVPFSPMQRAIADRTQRSKSEIPHYYASIAVDMSVIQDLRRQMVKSFSSEASIPSITDICLYNLSLALKEYPLLNASYHGDSILYHNEINLGMVIGVEGGMIVPVIKQADRLSLLALVEKTKQLRQHAETGQLSVEEMGGSTFTLSNLGMYGLDRFTAVINPPEAGILAIGKIKEQPIGLGGEIVLRPMMETTLSVDHRVVDGITAAKFLAYFRNLLEEPIHINNDHSWKLG